MSSPPGGLSDPQPPGPNTSFVESWERTDTLNLLRELVDLAGQTRPAMARRAGLSSSELAALETLLDATMGPAELARTLGVTTAAASGVVDRLEARGHAHRTPHERDGRRTQVAITASGREEVIGHLMPMFLDLQRIDAGLSESDRAAVDSFLRQAIAAIRRLL